MFTSNTTERVDFLARQLSSLTANQSVDEALKQLDADLGEDYAPDMARLRSLLGDESAADPGVGDSPYQAMQMMLPEVENQQASFISSFVGYTQNMAVITNTYWASFASLIWYIVALLVVGLLVGLVFSLSVLPSFAAMSNTVDGMLPTLTESVFNTHVARIPVVSLVAASLLGITFYFSFVIRRQIQRLQPLPASLRWMPMLGGLRGMFNDGLFINYFRMLLEAGVQADHAATVAARVSRSERVPADAKWLSNPEQVRDDPILQQLALAARFNNLTGELDTQCARYEAHLATRLATTRLRLSFVIKLFAYLFVGVMVFSMYLPIFQMGNAVI
ncbi:MAG: hypothetical protein AAF270_06000 [Pseudomonadota bacterium]